MISVVLPDVFMLDGVLLAKAYTNTMLMVNLDERAANF